VRGQLESHGKKFKTGGTRAYQDPMPTLAGVALERTPFSGTKHTQTCVRKTGKCVHCLKGSLRVGGGDVDRETLGYSLFARIGCWKGEQNEIASLCLEKEVLERFDL